MGGLSNYSEDNVVNALVHHVNMPAASTTVYVAAHAGDPSDDGSTNEVAISGYARIAVTAATGFTASSSGSSHNVNEVLFADATADWGDIDHWSIWDAATTGHCLLISSVFATPVTVNAADALRFAAGTIVITAD